MSEQDEHENQARPPRTPPRQGYHQLIDQIIAKAQADGLMDNLPGQGQPLKLDSDELVRDEDRLAFRMLKSNGFAPPWIEAQREIDEERARLDTWLADANRRWPHLAAHGRAALRVAYRRKLDDLQRTLLNFNLNAPPGVAHIEGLKIVDELLRLGT